MATTEELIKRIMFLSHERGQEMGREEVLRRASKVGKYLQEEKGIVITNLCQALAYWAEALEKESDG